MISSEVSTLTVSSKVCMSCYKLFNGITKQSAQSELGKKSSNATLEADGALVASQINAIKMKHHRCEPSVHKF